MKGWFPRRRVKRVKFPAGQIGRGMIGMGIEKIPLPIIPLPSNQA